MSQFLQVSNIKSTPKDFWQGSTISELTPNVLSQITKLIWQEQFNWKLFLKYFPINEVEK